MADFKETLVNTLAPLIQAMVAEQLTKAMNNYAKNDIKNYKKSMVSMYVPIDKHLEDIVKTTKSKLDDMGVAALKQAIIASCEENNVKLPVLDGD